MAKLFRAVIMGPPGCGKGTISSLMVRDYKLPYIACGDVIRDHVRRETIVGETAKKYVDKGQLVPDKVVSKVMLEELKMFEDKHWLLDGFPRTFKQAEELSSKYKISLAINIYVPDDVILSRLKGRWIHPTSGRTYNDEFNPPKVKGKDDVTGEDLVKRSDDNIDVILERLASFRGEIQHVLEFYRRKEIMYEFHGNNSHFIYSEIKAFLESYFKDHGYPK